MWDENGLTDQHERAECDASEGRRGALCCFSCGTHQAVSALEGGVAQRRQAVLPHAHAPRLRDLRRDFAGRENTPVGWFCALTQLDLNHLDRGDARCLLELFLAEFPRLHVAAAEVARSDVPHDVSAGREVEAGDAALARVVVEAAHPGCAVQGEHGGAAEGSVGHPADVEERRAVAVLRGALGPAEEHAGCLRPGGEKTREGKEKNV